MYTAITKGLLSEAPQPHPRQVAPRQQGIAIQNKYEALTSKNIWINARNSLFSVCVLLVLAYSCHMFYVDIHGYVE